MTDRLLLVGMMAVGKTTVGERCAKSLGWPFLDSDAQLLRDTARSAQAIFEEDGDLALRALETRVLVEAIAHRVPVVIAVAGGAVLAEENRRLLVASGDVVWLRASLETMSERVAQGGARPRLGGDPVQALRDLYRTRLPLYAAVASVVIDVDNISPVEIAARILAETGLAN